MCMENPNFSAEIYFTVGIKRSAAVTKIEERWLMSVEKCDVVENDLCEESAPTILECMGVDLDKEGSFVANLLGRASLDESPDYEIFDLKRIGGGEVENVQAH